MNKLTPRRLGAALLLPITATGAVNTAQAQSTPPVEQIYVSGVRGDTSQRPVATTVTVIDREQIRLSGAQQVSTLLRTQAGVQLRDADGSGGRNVTVSMGGFGGNAANNTLVLVDGRKLNNPSLAGPALNDIPVSDIERIEIIQGSAGVLYGDQAVGGVINIVTRRPRGEHIEGYTEIRRGSHGQKGYGVRLAQGLDNGVHYRVSLHQREADHYRDNNEQEYRNIQARLGWDFAAGRIAYEYQRVDDELRLPGALSDEQLEEDRRQASTPDDFSNQDTRLSRISGEWYLSENWRLLSEYSTRETEAEGFIFSPFQQRTEVETLTPRLIGRFGAPGGTAVLTLGTDRQRAEYQRSSEFGTTQAEQDLKGNYGQLVYPLTAKLSGSAGLRRETVTDRDPLAEDETEREHQADVREWGLSYQFTPSWRLYGRSAEGFRFANVDEYTFTDEGVEFLDPQESRSTEVGLNWRGNKHDITTSVFRMRLHNEIAYDPSAGFGANVNLPDSEREGALVDVNYQFNERWSGQVNYTFTDATLAEGESAGMQVPFVARRLANATLSYEPMNILAFYVDAQYTGPRYRIDDNFNTQGELASTLVWNANMIWRDGDWELGIRVLNLTDEVVSDYQAWSSHSGNYEYPRPGRTFEGRLTYRFR
ncbi:TonB-dependent siderophore receptor [Marinimicrobium sp. ABcell2]|uniref:TonB-dependent receptor plug domain-containing protein n=1 Tax=Marinimicrobium sp. ABcell2 TaxID=3069751 RepID=UPI0027ADE8F8|nr:TonB-dependent receptor [Marinimicrobium sp. ABcell2]MDQ2075974.1 TonB-dependent receptor [Marinimicrobium sp. ABcell2]